MTVSVPLLVFSVFFVPFRRRKTLPLKKYQVMGSWRSRPIAVLPCPNVGNYIGISVTRFLLSNRQKTQNMETRSPF